MQKKKQVGADHADKRHQAAEKCIQEGVFLLLEKTKENKLSPHYEKEPYQVKARHGDQVQLKSPQGVQYKRNIQHVKLQSQGDRFLQSLQKYLVNKCVDKNPHPAQRWEPVQDQLRIRALSSNSCYQGDQGESPDLLRDSVTMSPPNGVCGFQVTLTLIVLYLQFFYLPDRTLLTLLMLFC